MNEVKALPKSVAVLFFLIGIISAICFRVIIIVQHTNPSSVRLFWYVAVIANFIFFLYRYYIALKRRKAIRREGLVQKIEQNEPLDENERHIIAYLLTSIERSREILNYLSIFILSAIAIIVDIVISLNK